MHHCRMPGPRALLVLLLTMLVHGHKRPRHTEEERDWARQAYYEALGSLKARGLGTHPSQVAALAVQLYSEKHDHSMSAKALREFILWWAVENTRPDFRDAPRKGRETFMSDEECRQCIDELRRGYIVDGKRFLYHSLEHAAGQPERCRTVAMCRQRYSQKHTTGMWARLVKYDPKLKHIRPVRKAPLSAATMANRVSSCQFYLDLMEDSLQTLIDYLKRVFFIDAKTVIFVPKSGTVIGYMDDRDGYIVEVPAMKAKSLITHKDEVVTVKFYGMANWHAGVCGFKVCQGTTGLDLKYKASIHRLQNNCTGAVSYLHASLALLRASSHALSLCRVSRRTTLIPAAIATLLNLASTCS